MESKKAFTSDGKFGHINAQISDLKDYIQQQEKDRMLTLLQSLEEDEKRIEECTDEIESFHRDMFVLSRTQNDPTDAKNISSFSDSLIKRLKREMDNSRNEVVYSVVESDSPMEQVEYYRDQADHLANAEQRFIDRTNCHMRHSGGFMIESINPEETEFEFKSPTNRSLSSKERQIVKEWAFQISESFEREHTSQNPASARHENTSQKLTTRIKLPPPPPPPQYSDFQPSPELLKILKLPLPPPTQIVKSPERRPCQVIEPHEMDEICQVIEPHEMDEICQVIEPHEMDETCQVIESREMDETCQVIELHEMDVAYNVTHGTGTEETCRNSESPEIESPTSESDSSSNKMHSSSGHGDSSDESNSGSLSESNSDRKSLSNSSIKSQNSNEKPEEKLYPEEVLNKTLDLLSKEEEVKIIKLVLLAITLFSRFRRNLETIKTRVMQVKISFDGSNDGIAETLKTLKENVLQIDQIIFEIYKKYFEMLEERNS